MGYIKKNVAKKRRCCHLKSWAELTIRSKTNNILCNLKQFESSYNILNSDKLYLILNV